MFSFVNRMDASPVKRAFVFVLAGVFLGGMFAPTTVDARDAKSPYIIPGDADGPAGVQEAVVIRDRGDGDVLPLCLSLGPWQVGLIVIRVDGAKMVNWFKTSSTGAHGLENSNR